MKEKKENYEEQIKEILSKPIKVSEQFKNAIDTAFLKKDKKIKCENIKQGLQKTLFLILWNSSGQYNTTSILIYK